METINHEYYVSLEVAKLLAEVGFDWECKTYYDTSLYRDEIIIEGEFHDYNFTTGSIIFSAPTLDVAQRWLRETQKYQVAVLPNGLKGYAALCFLYKEPITQPFEHYSTYEEALEVGIKKVLELILEKGE